MVKKRFIAGAVCPRCAEMDKIVMYEQDGKNFRECVACGYEDEMPVSGGANELPTRVNEKPEAPQVAEQVLNFVDPDKK
ncbi:MAG: YheV family putative zinc ribbon protein [Pseudomonadales bacterium]|jgi:hypothetical protein